MEKHVIATKTGDRVYRESRSLQMGYPSTGYNYADPSAIPPPGMGHMQRAGVVVSEHTLLQVDIVYVALRVISNNILAMAEGGLLPFTWGWSADNIKFRQYIREERPILTNTFGGGGLGGQAGTMMQSTGMDRTVWSMGLFGEAFWYILRDPKMLDPLAVEVLHPAFMEVKRKDGQITYRYGTGNNKRELEPENVVHIPLKSLPGANRGLAPTDYAGVVGALAMAAYEFGSSWFSQGQAPDFILSTDQKLGQAEIERIADKFMIRHAGLQQAHTPVVIDSGIKVDKVMASPDEAQYMQTLEYARQCVGAWFGLPPSKMPNALQRQPTAGPHTREEETIAFNLDTLSGYTIPLKEVFSALLADGEFACFNEQALEKPDAQFLAQKIQALRITQAASINDVRTRELGWAPVDDPRADDALAPLASNTAPSQTGSEAPQEPSPGLAKDRSQRSAQGHAAPVTVTGPTINLDVQPGKPATVRVDNHNHIEPTPIENHVAPSTAEIRVDVEPTPVNVTPEVRVEGATVNVEPTPIEVKSPKVQVDNHVDVQPADVNVKLPRRHMKVRRDKQGRIIGTEEE